jgi:uncharacterized membrane-anchored protein
MTTSNRWTLAGVALCGLGLAGLVGRAELVHQTRPRWRFRVQGYDPRDILRGHYLDLRYDFNRAGRDTCSDEPDCCLCLTQIHPEGIDPEVRAVACDEAKLCDGWVLAGDMQPPIRYFIPEQRATELEQALRDSDAALEVVVDSAGHPSLTELYLDGLPWRERLPRSSR